MNLQDHTHFSGSASDLAALAIVCGKDWGLPVDPDKTNERLVRYYVTEGIVDRPDRVGRDAAYGYRHLLQLLTARRMVDAGTALSVIGSHTSTATTRALEEGLTKPLPTAAEVLVSRFMQGKRESSVATVAASQPAVRPAKSTPPGPSIVDVLDEMRHMRAESLAELAQISTLQREATRLKAIVEHSADVAEQAIRRTDVTRD